MVGKFLSLCPGKIWFIFRTCTSAILAVAVSSRETCGGKYGYGIKYNAKLLQDLLIILETEAKNVGLALVPELFCHDYYYYFEKIQAINCFHVFWNSTMPSPAQNVTTTDSLCMNIQCHVFISQSEQDGRVDFWPTSEVQE